MPDNEFSADQIRNSVIQQLENLRRAGVTHWKKIARGRIAALGRRSRCTFTKIICEPCSASFSRADIASVSSSKPAPRTNLLGETESSEVAKKKSAAPLPKPGTCATFQPLNLPMAERITGLAALAREGSLNALGARN